MQSNSIIAPIDNPCGSISQPPDPLLAEILQRLHDLEEENKALKKRLNGIEDLTEREGHENAVCRQRVRELEKNAGKTSSKPATPGMKTTARLTRLDEILYSRANHAASFSEIGKLLELGSGASNTKKNTRKQNMNHFSKILASHPDRYIIEETGRRSSKRVRLTSGWRKHLQIQKERQR